MIFSSQDIAAADKGKRALIFDRLMYALQNAIDQEGVATLKTEGAGQAGAKHDVATFSKTPSSGVTPSNHVAFSGVSYYFLFTE